MLKLIFGVAIPVGTVVLVAICYLFQRARSGSGSGSGEREWEWDGDGLPVPDLESASLPNQEHDTEEELLIFQGAGELTICDILEAPGEVIGKSNYGTLYRAMLHPESGLRLLRFLRPVCTAPNREQFMDAIEFLGRIRHPNLLPLLGFYSGPKGEKLLIYPYHRRGNLADFIRGNANGEYGWTAIYKMSVGIARGLDHLHTGAGLMKPVIHGNLKSKNILLDRSHEPCISDYGLHLLLNPATGQGMLELLGSEGYKAPELNKMKDANEETDVFSLGVILLELITGKECTSVGKSVGLEELQLPHYLRNAVLGHRVSDLYHPGVRPEDEERMIKLFQLGMGCCSPSPSLRPTIKQVIKKLEELGT